MKVKPKAADRNERKERQGGTVTKKTVAEKAHGNVRDRELMRWKRARASGLKTILFVCTGNSLRSPIAEGIINHSFQETWAAFSAGVVPMDLNRDAVKIMAEVGIDISGCGAKHVDIFRDCCFDRIVILCSDAGRLCPNLPDHREKDHIMFHDPLLSPEGFVFGPKALLRKLREEIKKALLEYMKSV
jgi:arsenate reductase